MTIFAGPFVGEFGWELCSWHGWLRKIKQTFFKYDQFVVSSYPGRKPLYDFADEFIPLPGWFLSKNYPAINYAVEAEAGAGFCVEPVRSDLRHLVNEFQDLLGIKDVFYMFNFPQRVSNHSPDLVNKLKRKVKLQFLKKDFFGFQDYMALCNPGSGRLLNRPLFFAEYGEIDRTPQRPPNSEQAWVKLKPTDRGRALRAQVLKDVDASKPFISLFCRKRKDRRPDKNWTETKWLSFINRAVKELNLNIILCGEPNGSYFSDYKADNVINIISAEAKDRLDLQLACLEISKAAVHGISGSRYLSMQAGCPTFVYADEREAIRAKVTENPMQAEIEVYTKGGANPTADDFFQGFKEYYRKIQNYK